MIEFTAETTGLALWKVRLRSLVCLFFHRKVDRGIKGDLGRLCFKCGWWWDFR